MAVGNVRFHEVWKRFHRGPAHDSLRDLIPAMVKRLGGKQPPEVSLKEGDFWAVQDVSFEVKPGSVLGIIGGNGAGKSTILKLLTKVLTPTRGVAEVRGRAGALIEISAGFHPDLTGRENVFLQGAIMGMPQRLIRQQFDEIIEFSGIAPFIDTPVKRYSSGMNARLGFAIAVHLEPEALIIDEVLSVGDAEFQGRAFDKIRSLVRSGIPVVIVSHQLDRIVELCSECILLRQGQVAFKGSAAAAVHEYLHNSAGRAATVEDAISAGIGFLELRLPESGQVVSGASLAFSVVGEVTAAESPKDVELEIVVVDAATNTRVYCNDLRNLGVHPTRKGPFQLECTLQAVFPPGLYRVETVVWHATRAVIVGQGPTRLFQVTDGMPFRGTHQVSMAVRLSPPTRA